MYKWWLGCVVNSVYIAVNCVKGQKVWTAKLSHRSNVRQVFAKPLDCFTSKSGFEKAWYKVRFLSSRPVKIYWPGKSWMYSCSSLKVYDAGQCSVVLECCSEHLCLGFWGSVTCLHLLCQYYTVALTTHPVLCGQHFGQQTDHQCNSTFIQQGYCVADLNLTFMVLTLALKLSSCDHYESLQAQFLTFAMFWREGDRGCVDLSDPNFCRINEKDKLLENKRTNQFAESIHNG